MPTDYSRCQYDPNYRRHCQCPRRNMPHEANSGQDKDQRYRYGVQKREGPFAHHGAPPWYLEDCLQSPHSQEVPARSSAPWRKPETSRYQVWYKRSFSITSSSSRVVTLATVVLNTSSSNRGHRLGHEGGRGRRLAEGVRSGLSAIG